MILFFLSSLQSLVLLGLVFRARRWRLPIMSTIAIAAVFAVMNFLLAPMAVGLGSPAVLLHALLTLLVAIACGLLRAPPWLGWGSLGSAVVAFGVAGAIGVSSLHRLYLVRQAFPLESMSRRLAYETAASHGTEAPSGPHASIRLAAAVDERLSLREASGESNSSWMDLNRKASVRARRLKDLHDRQLEQFIAAEGFGQTRMRALPMLVETVELPSAPPIALAPRPYSPETQSADRDGGFTVASPEQHALHRYSAEEFVSPLRTGYIQDRDHVAGFLSHRIERLGPSERTEPRLGKWLVVRMELVSLLKHPEPRVYLSDVMPQMDRLNSARTRPLSPFELRALETLHTDEDLVIDETPQRILMLGALRAGNDCRQCHTVPRGALLGAFSDELVRDRPVPAPRTEVPPPA